METDAFGAILRAALAERTGVGVRPTVAGRVPRPVIEIVERDDGFVAGNLAARYLDGPAAWWDCERRVGLALAPLARGSRPVPAL